MGKIFYLFFSLISSPPKQDEWMLFEWRLAQIRQSFTRDLSVFAFKLSIGTILTAAVTYAVLRIGIGFLEWVHQVNGAEILELMTLVAVSSIGTIFLYALFKVRPSLNELNHPKDVLPNSNKQDVWHGLAGGFLQGFVLGYYDRATRQVATIQVSVR